MSNIVPYQDMQAMAAAMAKSQLFGMKETAVAESLLSRLYSRVERCGECWLFTGSTGNSGYGKLRIGKSKDVAAHRVSYAAHHGPIPNGMCVLHSCDVRRCVNPAHLGIGTKRDNTQDMVKKGRHFSAPRLRTHCPKGHLYSGTNSRGARICRTCQNAATLAHYYRTKR